MKLKTIALRLAPAVRLHLELLAGVTGSSPEAIVAQAVEEHVRVSLERLVAAGVLTVKDAGPGEKEPGEGWNIVV